jgi:hypothetical protein
MSSVFHYTDSVGLLGILKSKLLFAADYRYLNDISEGSMIRDPIVEIFEAEIAALAPKLHEHGLLESINAPHRQLAERFYQSIVNALDAATPIFVLSFCHHTNEKHIQHGLLSQWRGYAGSAGFAIEFDEARLCELIGIEMNTFAHVLMKSDSVHYENYKEQVDPDYYRGVAAELIRRRYEPRDVSHITGRLGHNQMDTMMIKPVGARF